MTSASPLTFDELCRLEPGLGKLAEEAALYMPRPGYSTDAAFGGYPGHGPGLKGRMVALVGWDRPRVRGGDPILFSGLAHHTAYSALLNLLPPDEEGDAVTEAGDPSSDFGGDFGGDLDEFDFADPDA
ncbi:MAG TPA: hypothetical protein VHR66_33130 [Gemmataceae bacterium]|jgi:hypothetical protein|nr:hypothetical protein [Gemmataceae bacterium]